MELQSEQQIMADWESSSPKISVCCITFNHEKYIEEALHGFLMQQTKVPFEILIHDDASTDSTQEILKGYQAKYPNLIFGIYQTENQWSKGVKRINPDFNFSRAKGKYIAMCEGDDFWTDPFKLQKQYEYLEANPDCSVCFTATTLYQDKNPEKSEIYRPKKVNVDTIFTIEETIWKPGNFMTTVSMFFRTEYVKQLPEWVMEAPVGDMPLSLYLGTKGDYGYINDVTCSYRLMASGSWSANKDFERRRKIVQGLLKTMRDFNEFTNYKYDKYVKREIRRIKFNDKKSIVKRAIAETSIGAWLKKKFNL